MPNQKIKVDHFSSDYVWKVPSGDKIEIIEKAKGGEGIAEFRNSSDSIVIKAKDQAPVIWSLEVKNCAEAAIITTDDYGYHLHVLEMKSRLTQGTWARAMVQMEGMYLSAIAVARLMDIVSFKTTTCYIAFTEDAMGPNKSADLILMKTFVGQDNPIGGAEEWFIERMSLPFGVEASIRKGQRDDNKNVNFGSI